MPLVTATVIAYAAGLLAGFGSGLAWLCGAGAVAAVAASASRHARDRALILACGIAAFGLASAEKSSDDRCRASLSRSNEWTVKLESRAEAGSLAAGRADCGSTVRIATQSGLGEAGSIVRARGQPMLGRAGVLLTDAGLEPLERPSVLARWRSAVGRGIDARFGEDAPLVRALLIADMRDLPPSVRDRFAAAGLSHMLSVSGLHVGLIALAVLLIAQVLRLPRAAADSSVIVICAAYVALIGAPLPAVRSAAMLAIGALSKTIQRPTSAWAVLAVGAGLPLIQPTAILDIGYQLSVVGMVALIAAGALAKRVAWLSIGGWRGTLLRGLATSTIATLLTAPLVAATFGRVALIGPLSNLAAGPVIAVLQPMLFLAMVVLPVGQAAQFVADACHPLLAALNWIGSSAAAIPGATTTVVMDQIGLLLALACAAAIVVATVSRFPGRALVVATSCLALIAWRPVVQPASPWTELHMIDVGQGDALALRTRAGTWVLFDAGRDWIGGDEGTRDVVPYLRARGGRLMAFVLSHPHADHVGGAASVLKALRPALYFDPGYAGGTRPYETSLREAREVRAAWRRVHPGDTLVVDEARLVFLAPDSAWAEAQHDPNLASAVVRVEVGAVSFLLTGDAEAPEERWLVDHEGTLLAADVLKVAHHGSRTSSTASFLEAVAPRVALVSVGAGNMYGHPSASVLDALARRGSVVLRTDRAGTVVIRTDGRTIEVESGGERWQLPPR